LKYSEKWSILPLFTMDGYIAWDIQKGSYDTQKFNDFIRDQVIPQTPFPGPRSVLIMDNCHIHLNDVLITSDLILMLDT